MNEQELRQAMSAIEAYKAQLEAVNEQAQLLQMSLEDHSRAKDTLEAVAKGRPGEEVLMPIGGGAFVYAAIAKTDRALVGVGSGVSIDRPMEEAIAAVNARIGELMDALKKVGESGTVLEAKIEQLTQAVEQEYQRMRKGQK